MTTWSQALERGHSVGYAVTISGIPYVIREQDWGRVDSTSAPSVPSGYNAVPVNALAITEGMAISQEIDRETGVATGRAFDILLGWQGLEDYTGGGSGTTGLTKLFMRPAATALLTADVTASTTTTFTVDDTTDFTTSGTIYLGLECCIHTGKTGTTFTTVTRAVAGYPYAHLSSAERGYRTVSDVPQWWRGRIVTLWEHLLSPEGRMVGGALCAAGTYCRQAWVGFVDAQPRATALGMSIRCLPLVRLLTRPLGVDLSGEVVNKFYTRVNQAVTLTVETTNGTEYSTTAPLDDTTYSSATAWTHALLNQFVSDHSSCGGGSDPCFSYHVSTPIDHPIDDGVPDVEDAELYFRINALDSLVIARAEILSVGHHYVLPGALVVDGDGLSAHYRQSLLSFRAAIGWLAVRSDAGDAWQATTIPDTGVAIVGEEAVRFDEVVTDPQDSAISFLHIIERALGGGPQGNLWEVGKQVEIVTGDVGRFDEVLATLLQSSGQSDGPRGTYDTLDLGFGLGLDSGLQDLSQSSAYPFGAIDVRAVAAGSASVEDLLGGWLALTQQCLVQRRDAAGAVVLTAVSTVPVDYDGATTLDTSNVLIDAHAAPEPVDAPNEIKIELGVLDTDRMLVARDVPRVQSEGVVSWELAAPGASEKDALTFGASILALTAGQSVVELSPAPFVNVQIGDLVSLETAHPASYDWTTGARSPTQLAGRVLGWSRDLWNHATRLTVLLAGHYEEAAYLCPAATVSAVPDTTTLRVTPEGVAALFATGETIVIYTPGDDTNETTKVIDTITLGDDVGYDTIVTTVAHSTSIGDVLTHDDAGSAATRQLRYQYVVAGDEWR